MYRCEYLVYSVYETCTAYETDSCGRDCLVQTASSRQQKEAHSDMSRDILKMDLPVVVVFFLNRRYK